MATGGTDAKVVGMGDGTMQWLAPLQLVNGAGTVVASIDISGNITGAGTITGGATVASGGDVTMPGALAVTTTLGVTGATTLSAALNLAGIETSLTAHAGGTQAAALALDTTKAVSVVTTVGTAADSVKLAAATGSGRTKVVSNQAAANSMQLYAASTETINGVASATGVAVAAGKSALCVDYAAGKWLAIIA
jgi:hypothetical protein